MDLEEQTGDEEAQARPSGPEESSESKQDDPPSEETKNTTATEQAIDSTERSERTERTLFQKKNVKLTSTNVRRMQYEVHTNQVKHMIAQKHFKSRQLWFFTIPIGTLVAASAIVASISDPDRENVSENFLNISHRIVAALCIFVLFNLVLSLLMVYDKRAVMHEITAVQLRDLRDELNILVMKIQNLENPDIKRPTVDEEEVEEEKLRSFYVFKNRFQLSLSGCSSCVPLELSESFHGLISNLDVRFTRTFETSMKSVYTDFDTTMLKSKAIDILVGKIMAYRWYPLFLPDSTTMARRSTKELEFRLNEILRNEISARREKRKMALQHEQEEHDRALARMKSPLDTSKKNEEEETGTGTKFPPAWTSDSRDVDEETIIFQY